MSEKNSSKGKKQDNDKNKKFRRPKKKICLFCSDKKFTVDYKDVDRLKKFVSEKGKILPRRATGCCAKHQRMVTIEIKRARHIAQLPYTVE